MTRDTRYKPKALSAMEARPPFHLPPSSLLFPEQRLEIRERAIGRVRLLIA